MSDAVQSAILILSDLHFGADFLREAEIDPLQVPFFLKYKASKVRRFIEARCKTHDMAIVLSLPRYLKKVLKGLQLEGFANGRFDVLLVLGDLATYPNGGSYSFLGQYLTQNNYQYLPGKTISGLKSIYDELIAIPGNHDKLLRKNLDLFHSKFSSYGTIGPEPQPQRSFLLSTNANKIEFLFILIEASKYCAVDRQIDWSALSHLAAGEVTKELREEVERKLREIRSGLKVDKATLKNYGLARKILLVHYAVDDRVVLGPVPRAQELIVSHRCDGLDDLVRDLGGRIDLVLHGHLHHPRIYNHYGAQVISATTTTQKDGINGFFVLKFLASGDIVVDHHKWNQNGFAKDNAADLNARIVPAFASVPDPLKSASKHAG